MVVAKYSLGETVTRHSNKQFGPKMETIKSKRNFVVSDFNLFNLSNGWVSSYKMVLPCQVVLEFIKFYFKVFKDAHKSGD